MITCPSSESRFGDYLSPPVTGGLVNTCTLLGQEVWLYHTLSICLQTQFSQRYRQIKDRDPNIFLNIFGSA